MLEIINANSLHIPLADKVAACCVTSPPYYGLRDYGIKDQLGLEQTPDEYVKNMVFVFREVWRVLKDDGTLWLNLGDSYASRGEVSQTDESTGWKHGKLENLKRARARGVGNGIKPKDLIGIPWRVAFALQADGWYLRSDVIWHKPNPMPESVKDRCTKSHEYIFFLSKSSKYYYDHEAIKEEAKYKDNERENKLDRKRSPTDKVNGIRDRTKSYYEKRNKRDVWTVATKPYKGAHFATYPVELITPCILAGSRPGDIVIDPFNGSGTTGEACAKLGRQYIGIELNQKYNELSVERLKPFTQQPLLFGSDS